MNRAILTAMNEQPRSHRYLVGVAVGQRAVVVDDVRARWQSGAGEVVAILDDGRVCIRRDDTGVVVEYDPLVVFAESPDTQLLAATHRAAQWLASSNQDLFQTLDPVRAGYTAQVVLQLTIYAMAVSTGRPIAAVTAAEVRDRVSGQRGLAQWWRDVLTDVGHPCVQAALCAACEPWWDDSLAINGPGGRLPIQRCPGYRSRWPCSITSAPPMAGNDGVHHV